MSRDIERFSMILLLLAVTIGTACADSGRASPRDTVPANPRSGAIKILLYYDMEGLSGQDTLTSIDFPRPEYFRARRLLTDDVNATIRGLFDGGADSVFVVDAHGSFNPEPDILVDQMDPRAVMLYRDTKFDPYFDLTEDHDYDAVVAVGMHSRTGGGGFCEHTFNVGSEWILNGMSVNESEILAYSWARAGVPLIFVSGDDTVAEQLAWMDWIECVTVKTAQGIDGASLRPVDEVHTDLQTAAARALWKLDIMRCPNLTTPITATLRATPPADLSLFDGIPGVDYRDQSVTFQAADFDEAYRGIRALMKAAQTGLYNIAAGLYLAQGDDAFMAFKAAAMETWRASVNPVVADEDDGAPPPAAPGRRYFGSR